MFKGNNNIVIRGARVNNLKNIDLAIPRNRLVVITGLSGSGKSSLAFDTLYAEGQRRFAESLSSYARQFLGRMSKPDVDTIEGIPPAIAIEQRVNIRNPRSSIATTSEIYDYLRLLFARAGHIFSPVSGKEVHLDDNASVVRDVLETLAGAYAQDGAAERAASRAACICADLKWDTREDRVELMLSLKEEGYTRLCDAGGRIWRIEEVMAMGEAVPGGLMLLVDRIRLENAGEAPDDDVKTRLWSSVQDAFDRGGGNVTVVFPSGVPAKSYCNRLEADGIVFHKADEYLFSFNSPIGACPRCSGLGRVNGISEDLVVPDKSKSIYDGALAPYRGDKMQWFKDLMCRNGHKYGLDVFKPYCRLTDREKEVVWKGVKAETEEESIVGLDEFFAWVNTQRYKIQYKYMLSRFSGRAVCPKCHGSRLRPEALWVKVNGRDISEVLRMSVEQAYEFFTHLELSDYEKTVVEGSVGEIVSRLGYLKEVGLGYLCLDRASNTLSGGESQRVSLVTALGSCLTGSMYVLDEPSIGLHPSDTAKLIRVLKRLRDMGNTVVVVEHDEEIMRQADVVVDLGPGAGEYGGQVLFADSVSAAASLSPGERSLTLGYLFGDFSRYARRKLTPNYFITVEGAQEHNLQDIDVRFPLNCLCVVTGVSGSGKSTLVGDILFPALRRRIEQAGPIPGTHRALGGNLDRIGRIEYVDQNPIGKNSRSNPVTYLKIYDDIRKLMSEQQYAKISGYTPSSFSFNQEGGRCPQCQGEGFIKIPMQFMSDVVMECEECGGKRFKADILQVRYRGRNIDDILSMSVDQAIKFFEEEATTNALAAAIARKLGYIADVGLGYLKLGQSSSTLSGGESQRIKLAYFLSMSQEEARKSTLFIFDEPTTGLHFQDVETLLKCFDKLLAKGHSIVVVEHNPDVIRCADWVIDLGPGAGDKGGRVVYAGPVENICKESVTGKYI